MPCTAPVASDLGVEKPLCQRLAWSNYSEMLMLLGQEINGLYCTMLNAIIILHNSCNIYFVTIISVTVAPRSYDDLYTAPGLQNNGDWLDSEEHADTELIIITEGCDFCFFSTFFLTKYIIS